MIGALRRAAVAAVLVVVSSAVALGAVELLLRARPQLLGRAFAHGVLSKYTDGAGGIFYKDRLAQTRFMIPSYTTQMYANGYVWTHTTDALGFRNRTLSIPADIVRLPVDDHLSPAGARRFAELAAAYVAAHPPAARPAAGGGSAPGLSGR